MNGEYSYEEELPNDSSTTVVTMEKEEDVVPMETDTPLPTETKISDGSPAKDEGSVKGDGHQVNNHEATIEMPKTVIEDVQMKEESGTSDEDHVIVHPLTPYSNTVGQVCLHG